MTQEAFASKIRRATPVIPALLLLILLEVIHHETPFHQQIQIQTSVPQDCFKDPQEKSARQSDARWHSVVNGDGLLSSNDRVAVTRCEPFDR